MVKTVLGVNHQGLRDWSIQRMSAIYLALYSVGFAGFFLDNLNLDYGTWHSLFSYTWMKVATLLSVISLLAHAWVGMWTVFTDYVKPYVLCVTLNVIVLFSLLACLIWALQILWGV
ncbi:MAG: succinate dehydrogenase, hydrophobic membrane anchor protein [Pseudomonadota bacterium]